MDELLQQVSEETGIPVEMLERAARARAGAAGTTPEAIVAGWAGAEVPAAGAAPSPAAAPATAPAAAAAPAEEAPEVSVEVLEPEAPAPGMEEPEPEPEPVPVGPGVPRWLTAAFVVVPFIAILYALIVPNGPDCGNAGRLSIDPVTGEAVNCDGSAFGSEEMNFFATGESLFSANCAACHGPTGGGGAGPALAGGAVLTTFSACTDHIEWVTLGSAGWPDSTYGDTGKPVSGGMPSFEASLSSEEIASAVLYERVAFGGADLVAAESDCGLASPAVALGE